MIHDFFAYNIFNNLRSLESSSYPILWFLELWSWLRSPSGEFDWGLLSIITPEKIDTIAPLNQIKVLSFKEKGEWILESKYNIGKKKTEP